MLQAVLGAVPAYPHRDWLPVAGEVVEDHLLIRADKNPNRRGVVERFGDQEFDPAAGYDPAGGVGRGLHTVAARRDALDPPDPVLHAVGAACCGGAADFEHV